MSRHRKRAAQSGFTLIEVVVALTLAALATVLGAMVLKTGMDYFERSREYLKDQEEFRAMTRAVDSVWQSRVDDGFAGDTSAVQFQLRKIIMGPAYEQAKVIRLVCFPTDNGRFMLIEEYYADPNKPRTSKSGPDDVGPEFLAEEILARELYECNFSFLEATKTDKAKTARWVNDWPAPPAKAPVLLRLHVSLRRGELPPLVFTAQQ